MEKLKVFLPLFACLVALFLISCDNPSAGGGTPIVTFINETGVSVFITSTSLSPSSFTLNPHSRREVEIIDRFPITFTFRWAHTGQRGSSEINGSSSRVVFRYP